LRCGVVGGDGTGWGGQGLGFFSLFFLAEQATVEKRQDGGGDGSLPTTGTLQQQKSWFATKRFQNSDWFERQTICTNALIVEVT